MPNIVLVTGGRLWDDELAVSEFLDYTDQSDPISELVHGMAAGVDTMAGRWARRRGIDVKEFPANWDKYKKAAGAIRNQAMVDYLAEQKKRLAYCFVVAFPGGTGTADCTDKASKAGLSISYYIPRRPYKCL